MGRRRLQLLGRVSLQCGHAITYSSIITTPTKKEEKGGISTVSAAAVLDAPPTFSDGPWRYCVPGDGLVNWATVAYGPEQAGYNGCGGGRQSIT